MFPNSSNLGRPPFHPKYQQPNNFFKLPLNLSPTLSHQQIIDAQFHCQNVDLPRTLLNGNLSPISTQLLSYGNGSPIRTSTSPVFRGRKRLSNEQNVPLDVKRQRFHSPHHESTVANQTVPLLDDRRYSAPGSATPPLLHSYYVPDLVRSVPPFREAPFSEPREITLPVAKDETVLTQETISHLTDGECVPRTACKSLPVSFTLVKIFTKFPEECKKVETLKYIHCSLQ